MRPPDLKTFLHLIEQADQLARVPVLVDPCLELATIVERAGKETSDRRVILFEKVCGSTLPVVTNLFGTAERVAWAFGTTDLESLALSLATRLRATGANDPAAALRLLCAADEWQPVVVSRPAWRMHDAGAAGLDLLPRVTAWPGEGGPYLTLAQVFTRHPDETINNCGMYRIQCHSRSSATIRCRAGSGAARHLAAWHARGMAMPVAIALGGPPVLAWAAGAPVPEGIDEAAFCACLTGERVAMSACTTSDLQVPAGAEVVVEGVVEPGATAAEGPFGNHTGSYDADPAAPLLRVLAVHARENAVYPWTLVGPPPMENIQLARATERLFLPMVKMTLPTLRGLHLPAEGIFHRAAIVMIDPVDDRPLSELTGLLRSTALLQGSRLLIVGAGDHDPYDVSAVFWRTLNRVDWSRDLLVEDGRLAIDARRLPPGGSVRTDPKVLAKVIARWSEYQLG